MRAKRSSARLWGADMGAEIYYTEVRKDERGRLWYYINGDTGYLMKDWLPEDAEKHYKSREAQIEREIDFMRAYGFYD